MKKILLLSGSSQHIIAIKRAKELGYYTVLCDFLEDNPGQYEADKFYLVSTTDKNAVLDVAKKKKLMGWSLILLIQQLQLQHMWLKR